MQAPQDYFEHLIDALAIYPQAELISPPEIIERDNYLGELYLDLSYPDGSELHVDLRANLSGDYPVWPTYRFHYFHPTTGLRFRYDNAPHHRDLSNFPHHLHLSTEAILPYGPPHIKPLAAAIQWHLDHPGQRWLPES